MSEDLPTNEIKLKYFLVPCSLPKHTSSKWQGQV
jgi:hypothetical protein